MKKYLFKRVFLFYVIVVPILIFILEIYLSQVVKDSYLEKLRNSLIIEAQLIADQISPLTSNLDNFCREIKDKTGARITIIDSSGRVLGDSDEQSVYMDNHSNRPEIKDAEISGIGSSIRFSKTIQRDLFYLAILQKSEYGKRFIRLSLPLNDVEAAVNKIRMRIIIASLIALFIVVLMGLLQTYRITKSIEDITEFSKEVSAGRLRKRLFLKEKGEIGELGRNISNMAQEIDNKLKQREREKYIIEAILTNMSDGLILTDTKGIIIMSNSAIRNFLGIETSVEGKTLMEIFRKAELLDLIEEVVEKKEKISREIEVTYPKKLHLMTNASPYYSFDKGEEVSGVVLTIHDITRLKRLEEIRKDFVANVSHEIKTPLTAIKGFVETLLDGAIDDRENARKFLVTIKNHSERLDSLVSDLLTLSRIELGDIKIEKKKVDIDNIVDTVFTTLREKAEVKGLYLKKEILHGISFIKADKDSLMQILLNLVDNGIKFTEKGGVTIEVKSEKLKVENEEKDFIEISVKDTGIGIPKRHLSRIGERFYRVDSARSRELGGTGLGLAIVKHLVMAHDWVMEIESTEEKGTSIHIIIPESLI